MGIVTGLKYKKSGGVPIGLAELEPGDQLAANIVEGLLGRNRLINGNIDCFQERNVGTLQQQETYSADMWNVACLGVGATCNWGIGGATFGEVPGMRKFLGYNVVAGTTAAWLGQKIEGVDTFAGGKATVSFWMRSGVAGKKVGVRIAQTFGTGGSASTSIEGDVKTLSTTFQKFTVTFDVPSIAGKVIGSTADFLYLVFDINGTGYGGQLSGQTGLFEIGQVQFEAGSVATPFDFRPAATELMLCQRYYETSYNQGVYVGTIGTEGAVVCYATSLNSAMHGAGCSVQFKVTKRANPAMTSYSTTTGTAGRMRDQVNSVDLNNSFANVGVSGFFNAATQTTNSTQWNMQFHWAADARIN